MTPQEAAEWLLAERRGECRCRHRARPCPDCATYLEGLEAIVDLFVDSGRHHANLWVGCTGSGGEGCEGCVQQWELQDPSRPEVMHGPNGPIPARPLNPMPIRYG